MKHYPSLKNWTLGEGDAAHLGIEAERVGQVPGTHELIFESVHDSISIRHEAHSRRGFAEGALQAAEWLRGKHGFYSIDDWLNTRI